MAANRIEQACARAAGYDEATANLAELLANHPDTTAEEALGFLRRGAELRRWSASSGGPWPATGPGSLQYAALPQKAPEPARVTAGTSLHALCPATHPHDRHPWTALGSMAMHQCPGVTRPDAEE